MLIFLLFLNLLVLTYSEEVHELRSECLNEAQLMDTLIRKRDYSKHKLPRKNGITVSVEFWIQEINSISEMTNDFELEMFINEMWTDPNLRLWTPNTCFVNSKFAEIYESPFQNVFLTLFDNGTVWVNYRVRVKGPCNMDLEDFPMDTQSCRLNYQSFSYNNDEVRLQWNNQRSPVFALQEIRIADFWLKDITPAVIKRDYPAGYWDELVVTFVFERRYMWYFLQAYLPTFFSIFISWIAFSLGPQAITPRTMIGVNALLSMIFHFGSIMKNLPRVSYIKAIGTSFSLVSDFLLSISLSYYITDVWMLSSMTFVFLSLIELAIVGYKLQMQREKEHVIERVDRIARFAFPAGFSIFNIIYWARYGFKVG
ncbi:CRE-LGC-48 protein [Caenorhabditis remanei]|uniref:CRE-LGC-48 protein n=1 Tax=Caenorhabditis remanei TaxID=31234 RepID=E3LP79_CAERE|nr:CRE-LGC-48 protein [Caenorhabditis remanei]